MSTPRVDIDSIAGHFQELEVPRSSIKQRHPLESMAMIALLALLKPQAFQSYFANWLNGVTTSGEQHRY